MTTHTSSRKRWATLLDLPTELHKMIVKARRDEPPLYEDGYGRAKGRWIRDIRSLSTVAKGLTDVCQEELLQEVRIGRRDRHRDNYMEDRLKSKEALIAFCNALKMAPHLSGYVQTLRLHITGNSLLWDSETKHIVEATLRKLSTVTRLHLVGNTSQAMSPLISWEHYDKGPQGLTAGLLSIIGNPRFRHLILDEVEMPACLLAKSKDLQTLELHDSPCFFWEPECYPPAPLPEQPIYLDHLVMTQRVSKGLFKTEERRKHSNIDLSKLTKFEAPLDPERLARITQELSMLELLRFTVNYAPPENVATTGPLSFLSPLSFTSLKELEGLTRDRSLLKLTCLRRLKVAVNILGKYGDLEFNTQESFGEEWGTLQTVLLPSGGQCPLTSLQEVHLTVIYIDEKYNPSMVLVEEFQQRVVLSQLSRLREIQNPRFFCSVERTYSITNTRGYPNLEPYEVQTISLC